MTYENKDVFVLHKKQLDGLSYDDLVKLHQAASLAAFASADVGPFLTGLPKFIEAYFVDREPKTRAEWIAKAKALSEINPNGFDLEDIVQDAEVILTRQSQQGSNSG